MTRLPGALCAFAACAVGGRALAAVCRERAALLEKWESSLYRLKNAAASGGLPLPRMLKSAKDNTVLSAGADALEKTPGMPPEEWWAKLPLEQRLPPEARALLQDALLSLFDYPAQRQIQALERAISEFSALRRREKEKCVSGAALAKRLGLLLGAAVFILLC